MLRKFIDALVADGVNRHHAERFVMDAVQDTWPTFVGCVFLHAANEGYGIPQFRSPIGTLYLELGNAVQANLFPATANAPSHADQPDNRGNPQPLSHDPNSLESSPMER